MTDDEWRKSLHENFSVGGQIGGNLWFVGNAEDKIRAEIAQKFRGQSMLLNGFMGFFLETLELVDQRILRNGWPKNCPNYAVTFTYFTNIFRRFRACELLFETGYPLDGYSLIRDVKDRAFLAAAVGHDWCTFTKGMGDAEVPSTHPDYESRSVRAKKEIESLYSNRLMGKTSTLAPDVQQDLKTWDSFFNYEVHGGMISWMQDIAELVRNGRKPEIGPTSKFDSYVMYMNRSAEIGWLITRLLPYLQMCPGDFGTDWEQRRLVLDNAFRHMVGVLGQLGKRIGASFITMVDTNFKFPEPFSYFEASGTLPRFREYAGIDTRKKFDNALNSLMTETCRVWDHWTLLVGINESYKKYPREFNESGQFWRVATRSLADLVVIRLAALLDPADNVVSMPNLLRIIGQHARAKNSILQIGIDNFDHEALEREAKSVHKNETTVAKIRTLRNKFVGHRDLDIIANHAMSVLPELSDDEVNGIIDRLYQLIYKYLHLYGLTPTLLRYAGYDDYKRTLELVKAALDAG